MLDLLDELKALTRAFDAQGLEYALCGGLALAVYAVPRATIDIDILARADQFEDVRRVAGSLGYTLPAAPMSFAGGAVEIRRLSKPDPGSEDVLMLDVLLVTPAIESAWEGRKAIEWEGGRIAVVSPEGLIRLKQLRGSGQDLEDIRRLRERVDVD